MMIFVKLTFVTNVSSRDPRELELDLIWPGALKFGLQDDFWTPPFGWTALRLWKRTKQSNYKKKVMEWNLKVSCWRFIQGATTETSKVLLKVVTFQSIMWSNKNVFVKIYSYFTSLFLQHESGFSTTSVIFGTLPRRVDIKNVERRNECDRNCVIVSLEGKWNAAHRQFNLTV